MKTLIAILLVSAMLLFGCATAGQDQPPAAGGNPPQGDSPPSQAPPSSGGMQGNGSQPSGQGTASPPAQVPPAAGNGPSAAPAMKKFTIQASQWSFSPDTITVDKGDTVEITLVNSDVSHGILIPAFGFDLKAEAGKSATASFIADKNGTYPFRCNVLCGEGHREMTGTLVVK